jgi:hypothetical protein
MHAQGRNSFNLESVAPAVFLVLCLCVRSVARRGGGNMMSVVALRLLLYCQGQYFCCGCGYLLSIDHLPHFTITVCYNLSTFSVTMCRMMFLKMIVASMMLLGMMASDTTAFQPRRQVTTRLTMGTSQHLIWNGRGRDDSPDRLTVVECGLIEQTETLARIEKKFDAVDMKTNLITVLVLALGFAYGMVNFANILGAVTSVAK